MSWEDEYLVGQKTKGDQIVPVVEPSVDDEISIESSTPNPDSSRPINPGMVV